MEAHCRMQFALVEMVTPLDLVRCYRSCAGRVKDTRLSGIWVSARSGLLGFPPLASQDGSHSLLPSVRLKPNTSSHSHSRSLLGPAVITAPAMSPVCGKVLRGVRDSTEVTASAWHGIPGVCGLYSKVVIRKATWPSRSIQELGPEAWSSELDCCCPGQCSCESRRSVQVCARVQRPQLLRLCPASGRPVPPITLENPLTYFPHKPDYF